jgi:hypothetical protein
MKQGINSGNDIVYKLRFEVFKDKECDGTKTFLETDSLTDALDFQKTDPNYRIDLWQGRTTITEIDFDIEKVDKVLLNSSLVSQSQREYIVETLSIFVSQRTMDNLSDQDLINELRNRKYVMDIWSINDVDEIIDDIIEDNPEEYKDLTLPDEVKMEILRDLYEDSDKSSDFEMIREKIEEKYNDQ